MEYFVEEREGEQVAYKAKIVKPKSLSVLSNELAVQILRELGKREGCAMDIARRLKVHEQKVYYHLRRLEKAGLVKVVRREERVGALAKIYSPISPFIAVKLFEGERIEGVKGKITELEFLKPFIERGKPNFIIILGSPDPHGKYGAQASDGFVAVDLGLFLGTFLTQSSLNYKLDTEIDERDLKQNLILVGGPKANMVMDRINKRLPIYFDSKNEFNIISKISRKVYVQDDVGIIIKIDNPFAKKKKILVIGGKKFKGTRAAVVAVIKKTKEIVEGNKFSRGIARVVRGIDRDCDGRIDDVEFLE